MTAPDLVEVVAEVLGTHLAVTLAAVEDGFYVECRCGAIGQIESDAADWEPANQWHAAHQARAVLDALTEAGSVEWAIFRKQDGPHGWPFDTFTHATKSESQSRIDRMYLPELRDLVEPRSRLVLPWTAVE